MWSLSSWLCLLRRKNTYIHLAEILNAVLAGDRRTCWIFMSNSVFGSGFLRRGDHAFESSPLERTVFRSFLGGSQLEDVASRNDCMAPAYVERDGVCCVKRLIITMNIMNIIATSWWMYQWTSANTEKLLMLSFQHPHATQKVKYSTVYNLCNPVAYDEWGMLL